MNPESPTPREQVEARLTALLLGELSADDAAALREVIARDPQLAALHDRMKQTIELVRETALEPSEAKIEAPTPMRLSDAKREKLLAQFKTVKPAEFQPERRQTLKIPWTLLWQAAAVVAVLTVLSGLLMPRLAGSSDKARRIALMNGMSADTAAALPAPTPEPPAQKSENSKEAGSSFSAYDPYTPEFKTRPAARRDQELAKKDEPSTSAETPVETGPTPVAATPSVPPVLASGNIVLPPVTETVQLSGSDNRGEAIPVRTLNPVAASATPPVLVSTNYQTAQASDFVNGGVIVAGNPVSVPQLMHQYLFNDQASNAGLGQNQLVVLNGAAPTAESFQKNRDMQDYTNRNTVLTDDLGMQFETVPTLGPVPATAPASANGGLNFKFANPVVQTSQTAGSWQSETPAPGAAPGTGPVFQNNFGLANAEQPPVASLYDRKNVPGNAAGAAEKGGAQLRERDANKTGEQGIILPTGVIASRTASESASNPQALGFNWTLGDFQPGTARTSSSEVASTPPANGFGGGGGGGGGRYDGRGRGGAGGGGGGGFGGARGGMVIASGGTQPSLATGTAVPTQYAKAAGISPALDQLAAKDKSGQQLYDSAVTTESGREATATPPSSLPQGVLVQRARTVQQNVNSVGVTSAQSATAAVPIDARLVEDRPMIKSPTPPLEPQPEVLAATNAFSTFSLNVSDVSFKLAQASLARGLMPDAGSVRSEEFINAFDYRDPAPAPGAPIGFAAERAHYPFAHNRDLLRFSVKTAASGREAGRPLNLVLVLDNSGSMERADRVAIIHEAMKVLASQLQQQDTISVVTFARTARLWVDGIPGLQAGQVLDTVGSLTPEGGTDLGQALDLGYATAHRHYLKNGVNRVVLLTDGAANLGNVDANALKASVEAQRKQGIDLDCFGIGWEGYNDDLLEVLTRNGDGRYGFINTPEEAASGFASQLAGALRVAASDVKVQVEFNPARVISYRQIGYAKHQLTKEQFRDNTVAAAQIGAAEAGNALYIVELNPNGSGPVCTVHVRYRDPGTANYYEHAWDVPYTGGAVDLDQASPAMRLAATAAAFSEWLGENPFAVEVTPDALLKYLNGVPAVYGADTRPAQLETMIREAKSATGK